MLSRVRLFVTPCSLPVYSLYPCDSPGKNTGVGCHALLQGIFPTQVLNPGVPHCRQILYIWATREAKGKGGEILFFAALGTYYPAFDNTDSPVNRMNWNKTNLFQKIEIFHFHKLLPGCLTIGLSLQRANSLTNRWRHRLCLELDCQIGEPNVNASWLVSLKSDLSLSLSFLTQYEDNINKTAVIKEAINGTHLAQYMALDTAP